MSKDSDSAAALFDLTDQEVWLVTSRASTQRGGLIATFVSRVSLVPELPRVLLGLAKHHYTRGLIEQSGVFALHLLGEEQLTWVWRFGLYSGRDQDKFQGLTIREGSTGSPLLADALGWLDCRVEARMDTGDRTVYLGEVVQAEMRCPGPPLTLKRLLQLAPPERLEEERKSRLRDSAADATAIRAWRQRKGAGKGM